MHSSTGSFQWPLLVCILVISFVDVTATKFNIPRLSPIRGTILENPGILSANISEDFQTFYYNQTLDHFNYRPESYSTFQQRYVINFKFWGGANNYAPIFAYLGAEAPLDGDLSVIGFLTDNAIRFNALLVYVEHRYYGKSIPFGSREEALQNASTLGYFNSAQAIADYADILLFIKEEYNATRSPVIVIGGSYGGMLASWFRLKYPHVALGALASSAPILYFDDITPQNGYYSIVTKDFKEASQTCYETILNSWSEIDEVASKPDGLSILNKKFKTCKPLKSSSKVKDYLETIYAEAAQYNHPPKYPVTIVCNGIDGAETSDILDKIFAGVVAYRGNKTCYVNPTTNESETTVGYRWQRWQAKGKENLHTLRPLSASEEGRDILWDRDVIWGRGQTCSEMVMPIGKDNTTMFPSNPFNLSDFIDSCKRIYGVSPRPHWVTTYYGGHDIKLILQRYGSNIIFSNGLRDPYSSGGVLKNISDTVVAVHAVNGSHCLDILQVNQSSDPDWLVMQRKTEVEIIQGWISGYYDDLKELRNTTNYTQHIIH